MSKDTKWWVKENLLTGQPATRSFRLLMARLIAEEIKEINQEKEELEAGQVGPR